MSEVLSLDEIRALVDPLQLVADIETGFSLYSQGKVNVPPVGFLHFDNPPGDVHLKYGAVIGDDIYVVKLASAFYNNTDLKLPPSDGLILVLSQKTGELQLVLHDKCWLTDMRTAAAGAVAAKHLAPNQVSAIGIVGTGVQARLQLKMLRSVVSCNRCLVWGRNPDNAREMIAELQEDATVRDWDLELGIAASVEALASECNLIVTTTPATKPLVLDAHVNAGTHITAMGSDDQGKQELDAALLGRADFVVADSISQCIDHGECHAAVSGGHLNEADIIELGQVIDGKCDGRRSANQITIADLTGVAIQDIQIAKMVARAHRERNQ